MKTKPDTNRTGVERKARIKTVAIGVVVVGVIAAIGGIAIYRDRVAPFRTVVLKVGDTPIEMRYFLKRALLSARSPQAMLQTLSREQIIKQVAPGLPYNIVVRDEDVDQMLRDLARAGGEPLSESEYDEWYRQQRNESLLSDAEFRDLVRTNVLAQRLTGYLAATVPTVAPQVRLSMITLEDLAAARKVKESLDAGEDFGAVAGEDGGDFGWIPRRALPAPLARAAFDELDVGEVSAPLYLGEPGFAVIMVSERVAAREIDEVSLERIKATVLDDWLREETQHHTVEIHGFTNGYDSETDAWVIWQLQRMR